MNPACQLLFALLICSLCSSCLQRAYYQSPILGSTSFHAMPVASDSVKSAIYATGVFTIGGMNQRLRDNVFSFQGGLHRSHILDHFRINYGASATLGSYHVKPYVFYNISYVDTVSINKSAGTKSFGAYGVYGGVSAAVRLGRRGEWRYIGIEGSLFNEFGDYFNFRKNLPDTAATTIDKKRYLGALGISTELIFKGRSQNKFGMKFAFGSYLRSLHYYNGYANSPYHSRDKLLYFSNTYHFTIQKATAYVQFNISSHTANAQFGINYRL